MMQPQEIEAGYIIPLIRRELAKELSSMNISQKEISEILGISNAAVCQYSKDKRAKSGITFSEEIYKKIAESAKKMADKKSCAVKEINSLCSFIRKTKNLCRIHKSVDSSCNCNMGCCLK
jgi:hypothetical protein